MKYCLSCRQPNAVLKEVDEIKILYNDQNRILDFINDEDFKNKTFIIEIPKDITDIDWNNYINLSTSINLILCIHSLNLAKTCEKNNIKFYWKYPVISWYELDSLIKLNPCYIQLEAPLAFMLQEVKRKTDIPLRICPNLANDSYIPKENGLRGLWVRPEDTDVYENYIDVFDFVYDTIGEEKTLFHVYKDNKNWPGNLNLLLKNLNIHVNNSVIPEEFGLRRTNCGQRCMVAGNCHYCETAIAFANSVKEVYEKLN